MFLRVLDAVDATEASSTERLDVILVGLLELAPTDPRVRERIEGLLEAHAITEEQLGRRLLARAWLQDEKEST
ncbi:hypothetical protein ENKNEFLB_00151 [Nocardioides aquaticus]|uniref:Uncharacterized protein n=3 Tax=Actinomycetes TaxID=1760 RepID=A0ABX8ECN4_9ACTN|nr:hypothetical protein ENKNEFLB_00151 [Nocardioides aquaticus]